MTERINCKSGFTLIEMIGVVAIIAILSAFITPKVFEVIEDSKVTRFAGEVSTYTAAVTNWYKDIGSLRSMRSNGVLTATDTSFQVELMDNQGSTPTTGFWARWNGPYIDSVSNISLGTALTIESRVGSTSTGPPAAGNSTTFDLNDDNANDMANKQVVAIRLSGVTLGQFTKIDSILDRGLTAANNQTSGKVKYTTAGGGRVYIYIASL
ncbi:MAG: type II secretion system GspH family protein [Candidatus Scalindua rubra]|uniref:Prepilin-type N-terminal cleavage/methylation domain-containing protein n=1 Tax=Candidatus Scalindua brodae TaxID=237368 RepID=A0A0B0EJF6_9BACT|nr:MAG: hypothetical protein SCABRO_01106 [Candidatus Scalindua brodae]MBZ0108672.1 type II secretion system GspH family protein [Candidatus Scalindua rubra]TWU37964.1 hypothetical protein S225a_00100 [Candidatus Brocadiaceae bacterium S225]